MFVAGTSASSALRRIKIMASAPGLVFSSSSSSFFLILQVSLFVLVDVNVALHKAGASFFFFVDLDGFT